MTPTSDALFLRSQRAADDGEEVARQPLEDGPVLSHEKSLLDPGRQRRVGGLGGGDEARVLGVRVLAPHVEGHARGALLVEPAGERRERLDRHEEAGRGERQAETRLGVRRRVQREGHGPARGGRVDRRPPAPAAPPTPRAAEGAGRGARGRARRTSAGSCRRPGEGPPTRRRGSRAGPRGAAPPARPRTSGCRCRPSRPIFAPDGPSPRGRASATLRPPEEAH